MNIKEMKDIELKALVYDKSQLVHTLNTEINALNAELTSRATQTVPVVEPETPSTSDALPT